MAPETGDAGIRTVLLDLDGTLIDSRELILSSFRHTMREHLGEVRPDAEWLESMGRPLHVQLEEFAHEGTGVEAMMRTYLEHNLREHDDLICSFPRIRACVERLRERGYRLGIVTSKRREGTLMGLEACDYPTGWFDAIVTATDVERPKPDPAPVLQALEAMEEEASRAIFVGDSIFDLRAGRRAGTLTAAALWGPCDRERMAAEEPDYWLESVDELSELLPGPGAGPRSTASGTPRRAS